MPNKFLPYIAITLVMLLLAAGVQVGIQITSQRVVRIDAQREAAKWATYFLDEMPEIGSLLQTGRPSNKQLDVIRTAEKVGNVFRFKLFNLHGDMVLASDNPVREPGTDDFEHNKKALGVISSGDSNIALKSGTERANRPALYVEAYVPVVNDRGEIVSVVEVYLDQTEKSALVNDSFKMLAAVLVGTVVLAFGLPALGFTAKAFEETRARKKIEYLANYDPMTGLLNRASFGDQLTRRSDIHDGRWRNAAIVYLDVDNFKMINDTFGHDAGDQFLKHIAASLCEIQKNGDLVARMGGDEFILVAYGLTRNYAEKLASVLRTSIGQPVDVGGRTIVGTASVGIYWEAESRIAAENRIRRADLALYQAKIDGRNTQRFFSNELERRLASHRRIEQAIRCGIEDDRFDLNFQPLICVDTGRCAGFEALLRLQDEQGTSIHPADFIPVAEISGEIKKIGLWTLERAIATAARWPENLSVSVNLSVKQFDDDDLASNVYRILRKYRQPPSRLELEITETVLIENAHTILPQLKHLQELGVSLAMDDFGAGYSSLGYLWQFRFDKLKIDRSFIRALDQRSDTAQDILEAVIALGHKLNMTVTAEGIETASQARILATSCCDYLQGFYYGRPMKADAVAAYLLTGLSASLNQKNAVVQRQRTGSRSVR